MKFTRRDTLILAASATIASSLGFGTAQAQEGTTKDVAALANVAIPDIPEGSADAPVTMIEYASPTCPHCAQFSNEVYEPFKAEFVETGKVKLIIRPFIRNLQDAVVFLLAYAAGEDKYTQVLKTFYKTQATWGAAEKPRAALLEVATQLGFTAETFDAALANQELFDKLKKMQEQAAGEFKLEGTPTFYINGKQMTGSKSLEELKAVIDPLIPAGFQPTAPAAAAPAAETPAVQTPAEPAATPAPAADPSATPMAPATPQ